MTDPARTPTSPARFGLTEARSNEHLRDAGWWEGRGPTAGAEPVLVALSRSPDPDLALRGVDRLRDALGDRWPELDGALRDGAVLRGRLLAVLGSSTALADFLVANPDRWADLADPEPVDPAAFTPALVGAVEGLTGAEAVRALRSAYRALLCRVAAEDLAHVVEPEQPYVTYDDVAGLLSDLAEAALRAALDVAGRQVARADECTLAVIAMGKCGARELNYVSDVDVVFVGEGDLAVATRLASTLMQVAGQACFEVDAALRPEGKAGALVRTLDGHASYYRRWARTWEFQALLKARPVAGDAELGRRYLEVVRPMVWTAAEREDFVADVQAMRRRVEDHVPAGLTDRELKLGRGGLRDVEFAVQLLQLVHGRGDEELRITSTTQALAVLGRGGYVGRADAADFGRAYRFLRTLEHRLQLQRLLRTHLFPADDDTNGLRWLARAAGLQAEGGLSEGQVLLAEFRKRANQVRRLHEKLFYRPLLQAVANVPTEALRLTTSQAAERLAALGYAAPDGGLKHIEALTRGVSRRARIQTALLPVLLDLFAASPDPDGGLLAYRRVSEALAETPWYLRLLRDEGTVVDRLAALLGTSKLVPDLLVRAPEVLRLLADTDALVGVDPMTIGNPLRATVSRYRDLDRAVTAARSLRRQELLRVACADLLGLVPLRTVCVSLSEVWVAVLQAALDAVVRSAGTPVASIAVIGMGRLGGRELGYGSDADVVFVCEPVAGASDAEAARYASTVVERVRRMLSAPSQDPPLQVDADLRPEGRQGPLVRTLESYRAYYAQWSELWEAQALLRARFIAGDAGLGARFVEMVEPIRYPGRGLDLAAVREIRRIKARVEAERLPRGADPSTHTKLGRGGLADVEWTVQLLQLQHAHEVPGLRTPSTVRGLRAATEAGLVSPDDAAALREAWTTATRARNAVVLVRGKAADQLPTAGRDLAAVAGAMGHEDPGGFLDAYRRTTRRARAVVERVFYGS
ncbi:bifunctional [glutamine synthetase] adenylyltransferase/[glutamine synthetase]-adenylyl-L-tyrosine phosphorylase [Saccharothrix syringae]|uniref:Bifunctional glutamine synthetase adenylyltransferase/adenylyl-removing enzyme n=1 Tax=Saccharothrix syringae TaxID=103733 RepID=A0A5Q0GSJ1_SACSY|nr:bifunctional [glutamine synthetase] adenylyltransferase/[glutamine synthetase]-adenylyl-L-tyrosine phosphorylase [Saccharothrix syringae]QFZ16883.1 bifunctional [glutamine synthetase] adenylyltransferase/[glutamine synthetase]-adenylyl-L-tyrosine phosphorylase [Saccharothrix syringae]